jgi:hypothetical protein
MRTLALAALLLATACGKPLLYAEVEIPSAVVTVPQQVFPSTISPNPTDLCAPDPAFPTQPGNTCLQRAIEYDLGQDFRDLIEDAESFDLRLTELGIALAATDPLADFGHVYRVRLLAEGQDATVPAVELARYLRDPLAPATRSITVGTRSSVNLGSYVQAGFIRIRAELEFDQDIPEFTADVTGDFYLRVTIDWGAQVGVL